MKILLDECLPLDFRHMLAPHDAHTAEYAGLKGRKNGDLLRLAEAAGYDALLTVDQGIPHQQSRMARRISIIVVRSRTNQIEDLAFFAEAILVTLKIIRPGQIMVIPNSDG